MAGIQRKPRIKIKMNIMEHILEIISIAGLFTAVYYLIQYWPLLPDIIPSHFGFNGKVDGWGSKNSLYLLLGINIFIYLFMTLIRRFPHMYNYPVKIDENNAERQYQMAVWLMAIIKAEVIWMFVYIQWHIIQVALGNSSSLGIYFLGIVLVALTFTIIIYIVLARKNRDIAANNKKKK